MRLTFQDIISVIGDIKYEIVNQGDELTIANAFPIDYSNNETITWISEKYDDLNLIFNAPWGLVVSNRKSYDDLAKMGTIAFPIIVVDNPKRTFSIIAASILSKKRQPLIHANSSIHPNAKIGNNVSIGPFCSIGNCTIGDNTTIYNNCTIYDNVLIGNNVVINSGSVIGGDAFNFTKNKAGRYERFATFGSVILEDFVEIGANNCIDKGSSGHTILKKGVKTDNLVHIAHDVIIGENALIIANSTIAGHTHIGTNSRISPSASIFQRLTIGENVHVGVGSVVSQNIPDNSVYIGNPAIEISKFVKLEREKRKLLKK